MAKAIDGRGVAEVLDALRRKDGNCQMQADIPKAERAPWEAAIRLGFVRREKVQGFIWFVLTDEARRG